MSTSPLQGRRIVVTRAADGAEDLAARLTARGAVPLQCPVIETGPAPDPEALAEALRRSDAFDWVVFTSPRGVAATFEALRAPGGTATLGGAPRIACIGPATADALRAHGMTAAFMPTQYAGEALADELPDVAGRRILLLRAEEGRAVLRERLTARGGLVEDVKAYATRPTTVPEAVLASLRGGVDAVTFTAGSTVRHFLALPGLDAAALLAGTRVATIGPSTTSVARAHGVRVDIEAAPSTLDGILAALTTLFGAGAPVRSPRSL